MKNIFFPTRTACRDAARLAGLKPIDNGSDAPKGKRWSIEMPDQLHQAMTETAAQHAQWKNDNAVKVSVSLPGKEIKAPVSNPVLSIPQHLLGERKQRLFTRSGYPFAARTTQAQGHNGRKIPVDWRKNNNQIALHV